MGLDTSHDCWHGPYSAFGRFRNAVAAAAKEHDGYVPDHTARPWRAYQGWWDPADNMPQYGYERTADTHPWTHPLDVFFIHSDCDGYIFPKDAEPLADALQPLVALMEPNPDDWACHASRLQEFIDGLRRAYNEWQIVEFS